MTPPIDSTAIYDKSLYEAEESANKFETELIQAITGLPNIRWWHRNIARTGFAINGFINHYPDFIVRTRSGKIVIIETKGDHPANEETLVKLHLGRAWQAGTSRAGVSLFPRVPRQGYQHDRGVPHE